jgi:hypothetical protein
MSSKKRMRCLIVKDPWATEIVEGKKKREYRSFPIKIRERIGIIRAGSKTIIGEVDLVGCVEAKKLRVSDYCFGLYAWILENPVKYQKPRPYDHPIGAQIWVIV